MIMGKDGLQKWKYQSEEKVKKDISIATKASKDESLSWTARICAMAIANDVAGLKRVFETSDKRIKMMIVVIHNMMTALSLSLEATPSIGMQL